MEANVSVGADTRVSLFEEGDYEVALDYELTEDKLIDSEAHYENFREFIDTEHTPECEYISKCRRQMGFQGLNTLTPVMRERFLLHYLHGFTTAEIANLQSVSEYTVKESLKLARAKLDEYFKKIDL